MKVEIGKTYLVKVNDRRHIQVINEISDTQLKYLKISNYAKYISLFFKTLFVLSVLIFPPMIFFIRRKGDESNKLHDDF